MYEIEFFLGLMGVQMNNNFNIYSNSRIKLENIKLIGLRKVKILQVYADLCSYKSEVHIFVPKLQISASYRLSGNIGIMPVFGAGNLM